MSSSTFHYRRQRNRLRLGQSGFTLVELLVVIAIIGILVGLLLVAGRSAVIRANEFAVSSEITQMSAGIEKFKTKYGFYPPSQIDPANDHAQMRAMLARIAPNHRHNLAQLQSWHDQVGQYLNEETSMVFWLSGLSQSKQYPLTTLGGTEVLDAWASGNHPNVTREDFYDFKSDRLAPDQAGVATVRAYKMPYGKSTGDLSYYYFGSTSYGETFAYGNPYTIDGATINPNTFQVVTSGIDGDFGYEGSVDVRSQGVKARDNLTNFGNGGRLEVYLSNQ